ncbi:glutathione S-transferase 1-like [Chrysoperla carnea]|uniref:glutathione S-transferase 1-like n=1 Tax=Chrysoperla carnea TaxID=189513 RepID=UPI001D063A20|nr:glutathione S-transferase 1-like [Chrysoperla carnea]
MAPILYHIDLSPPCRAVRIIAAALNIPLELKVVNLLEKEHLSPEFVKINPQKTVPCLDDNGFILWDSHVIIAYLINKYIENDTPLYPKDLKIRSKIDQRNHFDSGVLFAKLRELFIPVWFKGSKELNPSTLEDIAKSYEFIEAFLENNDYLCGNHITIADISCATSVNYSKVVVPIPKELTKTTAWIERVNSFPPFAEVDRPGQLALEAAVKSVLTNL